MSKTDINACQSLTVPDDWMLKNKNKIKIKNAHEKLYAKGSAAMNIYYGSKTMLLQYTLAHDDASLVAKGSAAMKIYDGSKTTL